MSQKAPVRNAARTALAEAIEHRRFAESELRAAEDARSAASRRHYEATEKLEAHRAAVTEEASGDNLARSFIEANFAGKECDVATLARAGDNCEVELQNQIDVWRKTKEACAKVVGDCEKELQSATYRVEAVARTVVSGAFRSAASEEAQRLIVRLEELRAEIISIDLCDDGLSRTEAQKSAVLTMRCMHLENDGSAIIRDRWQAFFETLKENADEPFPLIDMGN